MQCEHPFSYFEHPQRKSEHPYGQIVICIIFIVPMNPCPCGYYPDRSRCNCKPHEIVIQEYAKQTMSYVYLFMNMHRTFSLLSLFMFVMPSVCLAFLFAVIVKYCFELSKSKKVAPILPWESGKGSLQKMNGLVVSNRIIFKAGGSEWYP